MVEHGVLAIEMEASALYTIAAGYGRRALTICTVSDHIVTGEETTSHRARADLRRHGRDRPGGRRQLSGPAGPRGPARSGQVVGRRPVSAGAHVVERGVHLLERHADQLGPGEAVDRELERVGGRGPVGLPVDDQERAVGLRVDRVDPAADDLAVEDEGERRLDGVRHPVGEGSGLERLDHCVQVARRRRCRGRRGPGGRRGRAAAAGRSAPRPRRGTACRTAPPATAAAASAGPARGRSASGSSWSRSSAVADRLPGSGTAISALRSARASTSSRSTSASQSATRALSTMSRPSSSAVGSAGAHQRRGLEPPLRLGAGAGRRPGPRGVLRGVGVGVALGRRVEPVVDRLAPLLELVADQRLVGRRPERGRPRAPAERRDRQPVRGAGDGDVAEPQLLGRLVLPGVGAVLVEGGLVVAAAAAAGRPRHRAAAPAARPATTSTGSGTGAGEPPDADARPGTPRPTRGPWRGGRSAA